MIQKRLIGTHTEIYSDKNGGGESATYITQSKTTIFHDFWTSKFLSPTETVADFREVTAAERQQLENIRNAWTRPPQLFIDQWNAACGQHGRYNEETGYFELNGLTDITYAEAIAIMSYKVEILDKFAFSSFGESPLIRTNLPVHGTNNIPANLDSLCRNQPKMEVLLLHPFDWGPLDLKVDGTSFSYWLAGCTSLKKIIGKFSVRANSNVDTIFYNCPNLEEFKVILSDKSISMAQLSKVSLQSVKFLASNRQWQRNEITITVHAKIYAKLTGDMTDADVAAMTEEERNEWQALIPLAAEKSMSFVSA